MLTNTYKLLKKFFRKSTVKYLVVGCAAFTSEYGTFIVLFKTASLKIYLANSISFCAGLLVSFTLNRAWTFKAKTYKRQSSHQLILYITLALVNLLITNLIIGSLRHIGISPLMGKIIAMGSIVIWNFVIFKLIIFKEEIAI